MEEELEILQSIYPDDIKNINLDNDKPSFEILISSTNTDNDDDNRKSLILTLIINFPKEYPNKIPRFEFKNIKGIIDEDIEKIRKDINEIANRSLGNQMLFEIIQHIRDFLGTCGNVPKLCKCPICLDEFEKAAKTIHLPDCYHYYHKQCLSTHLKFIEAEIEAEKLEAQRHKIKWKERRPTCPICRVDIPDEIIGELHSFYSSSSFLKSSDGSGSSSQDLAVVSDKMRRLQLKMKPIFERQKLAGGIIDTKEDEIIVLNRPAQNENETTTLNS